jgi:outer membrane protein assembly factor BamB
MSVLLSLLLWCAAPDAVTANVTRWPAFLGAGRSEIEPQSIPLRWSPTENLAWSAKLTGYGQSSPVIWGDQAYVTSVEGPMKDQLIVTALSLKSGETLWEKSFPTSDPVQNGTFVSRAAPTPVVSADGVYAFFESGDIIALSHAGETLWQKSLSQQYGKFQNEYGLAASPVWHDGRVFLLIDHPGPSYVVALDAMNGTELWKTDRTSRGSWTSPILLPVGDRVQLLCSSAGSIDGYDVQTGERLWTFSEVGGNRICTPMLIGDGTFLVGAQTSREFADTESVKKSNMAVRVRFDGNTWIPEVLWRTADATPAMASPMVHQGCAYWINRTGMVFCFDAVSGQSHYQERSSVGSCWATPLGVGNAIYLFGKDGLTTVIKAGPQFEVLAENRVWDPESVQPDQSIIDRETDPRRKAGAAMHALPEVCGVAAVSGSLLIRTGTHVYCVRETVSAAAAAAIPADAPAAQQPAAAATSP